mmetsp:Transcript_44372/g.73958  ORF Transcript_44372/g.73958 Transcript_44372/m.73958 type:complete len:409 (-) Transcript_44372:64-1290(-)
MQHTGMLRRFRLSASLGARSERIFTAGVDVKAVTGIHTTFEHYPELNGRRASSLSTPLQRMVGAKQASGQASSKVRRPTCSLRASQSKLCSSFFVAEPKNTHLWTSFLQPRNAWRTVTNSAVKDVEGLDGDPLADSAETKKWDLKGLKKETSRQVMRQWKKVSKTDERVKREEKRIDELMAMDDPPMKALEEVGDVDEMKSDLAEARERLVQLNALEEGLASIKSTGNSAFAALVQLAIELEVDDLPPPKQARGPKKQKQSPMLPRQPFLVYTSLDGIEIRVGRGSSDNDLLSCDPQYRDSADWWMHAAGHAGSHVVIRSHDDDLPNLFPETMKDAATLSAKNSKAPQRGKASVSYVRCRQVSKPRGAKAGLVHLNGDVATIRVDVSAEDKRLERLETTLLPVNSAEL